MAAPTTISADCWNEAYALSRAQATLPPLVAFAQKYDPTVALRQGYGANFETRLAKLLEKAQAMLFLGKEFPGNKVEVLLCMAHWVQTAPQLKRTDVEVLRNLRSLLLELVSDRAGVDPDPSQNSPKG